MADKVPAFKKGSCACESIGRAINTAKLNTRKIKNLTQSKRIYQKRESIKSRFLRS